MFVSFDPKKHKGYPLYRLQTRKEKGVRLTEAVPATTPFDLAAQAPWYYVVKVEKDQ